VLTIVFAILGGYATYFLASLPKMGAIRASALSTLFCYAVLFVSYGNEYAELFSAVFFGGSFVGMSTQQRLSWKGIGIASCIFGWLSAMLLPLIEGIGGALGICAFLSVVIVYVSYNLLRLLTVR